MIVSTPTPQIKTRQRVIDRGEVFTADCEVKAMQQLIDTATANFHDRCLEPACGTGNFLVYVLQRKLHRYTPPAVRRSQKIEEAQFTVFQALTTLYGIDICAENVAETRLRLLNTSVQWLGQTLRISEKNMTSQWITSLKHVLLYNIIQGDSLGCLHQLPVVEYTFPMPYRVSQQWFTYADAVKTETSLLAKPEPFYRVPASLYLEVPTCDDYCFLNCFKPHASPA